MANVISFKAVGLSYLDSPISKEDPITPRQVILSLTGLKEVIKHKKNLY